MVITSLMILSVVNYRTEGAPSKVLQGFGAAGQLTCADGSPRSLDFWNLSLNKAKGQLFGGLSALASTGQPNDLSINFNSGTITETKYTASGVGTDNICSTFVDPVKVIIQGRCGSDSNIAQVTLSNGARGTLSGTVACNH